MRNVTKEEYEAIVPIIQNEMIRLAKHENKNSFRTQIAINCCYARQLSSCAQIFEVFTPAFTRITENEYLSALNENPELFGTSDAKDVLRALYIQAKKNGWTWDEERYIEHLSNENFCLLLCKKNGSFMDNMLRIDLFRQIKESPKRPGKYDFVGGIFHALRHFSVGEQCASISPNQNVHLYDIEQLIWPIAKAFYEGEWHPGKKINTYETDTIYLKKRMTLEVFKESDKNVSFVNSIIPQSI